MLQQAYNPFLPSYEYIPDGEPHVFGDRLYLYGSHDRFNGFAFCLNDYVCWSAPIDNLKEWRYEGVIYKKSDTPPFHSNSVVMWAPDVCQGKDGKYYLYFFLGHSPKRDNAIHIAVCDTPAGRYRYLGKVAYQNGDYLGSRKKELLNFDPGVLVDDDGRVFLYSGFSPLVENPFLQKGRRASPNGAMFFELANDMRTVIRGPAFIGIPGKAKGRGTEFEGHEFFEASSLRKFGGRYYFVYSSSLSHELCYAVSDFPDRGFHFGGTLVSNGDIGLNGRKSNEALNYTGNTHGSIAEVNGKYYVFYHRQTNLKQFSRQACAEEIKFMDGRFQQTEMTSCGLNGGPLQGSGTYEARIACNLSGPNGAKSYGILKHKLLNHKHPYFTQDGKDREDNPNQYIANFGDGAWCGFKYFSFAKPEKMTIRIRGNAVGHVMVSTSPRSGIVADIPVEAHWRYSDFGGKIDSIEGTFPLYFRFAGAGHFDFFSFTIS